MTQRFYKLAMRWDRACCRTSEGHRGGGGGEKARTGLAFRSLLLIATLCFSTAPPATVNATPMTDAVINEIVINHVSTDIFEYVEVFGTPNSDYSQLAILEIEGDGTVAGTVDGVFAVGTTDGSGFWTTGFLNNLIENGTVTLLLVVNFTGSVGDDLDLDNDGILDITPFDFVVDDVAINDGGVSDRTYSTTTLILGFDGIPFTPGGASRIPDGTDTESVIG